MGESSKKGRDPSERKTKKSRAVCSDSVHYWMRGISSRGEDREKDAESPPDKKVDSAWHFQSIRGAQKKKQGHESACLSQKPDRKEKKKQKGDEQRKKIGTRPSADPYSKHANEKGEGQSRCRKNGAS